MSFAKVEGNAHLSPVAVVVHVRVAGRGVVVVGLGARLVPLGLSAGGSPGLVEGGTELEGGVGLGNIEAFVLDGELALERQGVGIVLVYVEGAGAAGVLQAFLQGELEVSQLEAAGNVGEHPVAGLLEGGRRDVPGVDERIANAQLKRLERFVSESQRSAHTCERRGLCAQLFFGIDVYALGYLVVGLHRGAGAPFRRRLGKGTGGSEERENKEKSFHGYYFLYGGFYKLGLRTHLISYAIAPSSLADGQVH